MELFIVELSRYLILILFSLYTFYSFRVFLSRDKTKQDHIFSKQRVLTLCLILVLNGLLILEHKSKEYVFALVLQIVFYVFFTYLYQFCYKERLSKLVLNHMMMCLAIGFMMLLRLDKDLFTRQILMATGAMVIAAFVPILIAKMTFLEKLAWPYALAGIAFLLLVFVIGVEKYGSRNWIALGPVRIQPSEFVKILFVFFIAAMLQAGTKWKHLVLTTCLAGVHVLILVAEKDLGAALIYFITYVMMLYVATNRLYYLVGGFAGGAGAALIAYRLFSHVKTRVTAWRDPWNHIDKEGYQICQSLFAIGTGGWIGMGFGQGLPESVPVVSSDFIFAGISEELGGIFVICLALIYISSFIMFVNIAMKINRPFYQLVAFGLSIEFIFQVFLCIGGVIKFIPSTGVTLPFISYGGSSVVATIIIFSIIQGFYIIHGDREENRNEEEIQ